MALSEIATKLAGLLILAFRGNAAYARWCGVSFGKGCRIHTRHFGSEPFLISLGARVSLSRDVAFFNHDGATCLARDERGRRQSFGRIVIGDDVFIGARSTILPGVQIGNRVIVGAGSVVSRSIPEGVIVAGNPAVIIGTVADYIARRLSDCPAQIDLPAPADYQAYALSALRPLKPPLRAPARHEP